jgi:hypothetical protein
MHHQALARLGLLLAGVAGIGCSGAPQTVAESTQEDLAEAVRQAPVALRSTDGTDIVVDYAVGRVSPKGDLAVSAKAPSVRVAGPGMGSKTVTAKITNLCRDQATGKTHEQGTSEGFLNPLSEGEVEATLPDVLIHGDGLTCRQELRVVVNDKALVDPINHTTTFRFTFSEKQAE